MKETIAKVIIHEGGSLNFLGKSMKVGIPLIKNVLLPLAKINFDTIRINSTSNRCSYSQENLWIRHDYTYYLKLRNERYPGNS